MLWVRYQRICSRAAECGSDTITDVKDFLPEEHHYCVTDRLTLSCQLCIIGWQCVEQIAYLRPDSMTVPAALVIRWHRCLFLNLLMSLLACQHAVRYGRRSASFLVLFQWSSSLCLWRFAAIASGDSHLELPFPPGLVPVWRGARSSSVEQMTRSISSRYSSALLKDEVKRPLFKNVRVQLLDVTIFVGCGWQLNLSAR